MTQTKHYLNKLKHINRSSLIYGLSVIVGVGLVIFVYVAVQQDYRMSANDPQIQIAEDGVATLARGGTSTSLVPTAKIDVSASLAPFTIVVDKNMTILASSGELDGRTPLPPKGVFLDAASKGERRFTWQTEGGYRFATVVAPAPNGDFVISARSLREVEKREDALTYMAAATFVCLFIAISVIALMMK